MEAARQRKGPNRRLARADLLPLLPGGHGGGKLRQGGFQAMGPGLAPRHEQRERSLLFPGLQIPRQILEAGYIFGRGGSGKARHLGGGQLPAAPQKILHGADVQPLQRRRGLAPGPQQAALLGHGLLPLQG